MSTSTVESEPLVRRTSSQPQQAPPPSSSSQAAPVPPKRSTSHSDSNNTSFARLFTIAAPACHYAINSNHSSHSSPPMALRAMARAASWKMPSSSSMSSSSENNSNHKPWAGRFRRHSLKSPPSGAGVDATESSMDFTNSSSDEEMVLFESTSDTPKNVLQWLGSDDCPTDVLPHILAFCGPQMTTRLQAVNRFWFHTIAQSEATWRMLCEDLYKWKPGDKEPTSWKRFYRENPCVPVDYKTVHSALAECTSDNVTVWMRPGRYYLKEGLDLNRDSSSRVAIQTMKLPNNLYRAPPSLDASNGTLASASSTVSSSLSQQPRRKKRRGSRLLKKFITCMSGNVSNHDMAMDEEDEEDESEEMMMSVASMSMDRSGSSSLLLSMPKPPTRATLVLRTRKLNEPLIRLQSGHFSATNINLEHSSLGHDIWNGNAAIQIQPPQPDPRRQGPPPPPLTREELPVALLYGLRVCSRSGRGVVTIDGGQLALKQSRVHDCAATGVYIGGRGSRAVLSETDVIRNGLGSQPQPPTHHHRRGQQQQTGGIARGHSGVYLEQGVAHILDCNVSNNTLTGVTAVSTENSTLRVADSDLLGNGSFQLEVPPSPVAGADAGRGGGVTLHENRLDNDGTGRTRAALAATQPR